MPLASVITLIPKYFPAELYSKCAQPAAQPGGGRPLNPPPGFERPWAGRRGRSARGKATAEAAQAEEATWNMLEGGADPLDKMDRLAAAERRAETADGGRTAADGDGEAKRRRGGDVEDADGGGEARAAGRAAFRHPPFPARGGRKKVAEDARSAAATPG